MTFHHTCANMIRCTVIPLNTVRHRSTVYNGAPSKNDVVYLPLNTTIVCDMLWARQLTLTCVQRV
jgi:hypothetical protein